jgi:hypothetical protein
MEQAVADWKADEVERQPLARAYHDQKQQRETATEKLNQLATYCSIRGAWQRPFAT